jgi:hypothetical protein
MISQNSSQITGRCLSGLTAHFLGIEGTLKERNKHKTACNISSAKSMDFNQISLSEQPYKQVRLIMLLIQTFIPICSETNENSYRKTTNPRNVLTTTTTTKPFSPKQVGAGKSKECTCFAL